MPSSQAFLKNLARAATTALSLSHCGQLLLRFRGGGSHFLIPWLHNHFTGSGTHTFSSISSGTGDMSPPNVINYLISVNLVSYYF
ncbi:hypothetical protein M5689_000303 [Euphorbia peplus]|nr:hypothetical protein M5689_000303 [Euphorbia peplus]